MKNLSSKGNAAHRKFKAEKTNIELKNKLGVAIDGVTMNLAPDERFSGVPAKGSDDAAYTAAAEAEAGQAAAMGAVDARMGRRAALPQGRPGVLQSQSAPRRMYDGAAHRP